VSINLSKVENCFFDDLEGLLDSTCIIVIGMSETTRRLLVEDEIPIG
jgi:hypothetical protein